MIVTRGKWVTACGHVVELDSSLQASIEDSLGETLMGYTAQQKGYGWAWSTDGEIYGLTPEWCEKLRIVGPYIEKENTMKLVSLLGKIAWKTGSYMFFDPAKNIALAGLYSIRYLVFVAMIVLAISAWRAPDATLNVVKALLPRVSVQSPAIFDGNSN